MTNGTPSPSFQGNTPSSTTRKPTCKAFVSSTLKDLVKHRAHAIKQLRKAGIHVDPMEDWTAASQEPKDFSQERVAGCDLCIVLVGFRRGYVPAGEQLSITQMEIRYAQDNGIDLLVFMLDEEAPWYGHFDERRDDPNLCQWRSELKEKYGVEWFGLPAESLDVLGAVTRWLQERHEPKKAQCPPLSGHVVICGQLTNGTQLVEAFQRRGDQVAVILEDHRQEEFRRYQEMGLRVFAGVPVQEPLLHSAGVERAKLLLALTDDDDRNANICETAKKLCRNRTGEKLKCILHVSKLELLHLLRSLPDQGNTDQVDLDIFNLYEITARDMLRCMPPWVELARHNPARILIAGLDRLGESLLVRIAKDWQIDRADPARKLPITLIDPDAEERIASLSFIGYDDLLRSTLDITSHADDLDSPLFRRELMGKIESDLPLAAAFVCYPDEGKTLKTTLHVRELFPAPMPIILGLTNEVSGVTHMVLERLRKLEKQDSERLAVVSLQNSSWHLASIKESQQEVLAEAIHQEFRADNWKKHANPWDVDSLRPWKELEEHFQHSNREQAAQMEKLLSDAGIRIQPASGPMTRVHDLPADKVELLATKEHDRWQEERKRQGWSHAPVRDNAGKKHPLLLPWEQLPADVKETNRQIVRKWPRILAKADYEIVLGDS
jgi:hypothetical protein